MLTDTITLDGEGTRTGLLIAVHGSDRDRDGLARGFEPLAARGVTVAIPLFPQGDDYKFMNGPAPQRGGAARALDRLIDEMAGASDVWLFGFSGGAQLVQRYTLARAARLSGAIVAAPGSVTLPRSDLGWWPGLDGMGAATGFPHDIDALRRIPVIVTVGADDRDQGLVRRAPGTPYGHAESGIAGGNRIAIARTLVEDLSACGVDATLRELTDVGHDLQPHAEAAVAAIRHWIDEGKNVNLEDLS